jgi:tripartite-type tricarboxylate transporter receptor subunit TctC
MPKEAGDRLAAALKKAYDSKEFQDFMAQRGFGVIYGDPARFEAFMAKSNEDLGKVMKAVGIAK